MRGRLLATLGLSLGLIIAGCGQAPEPQGAEIVTPPAPSPIAQPTDAPPTDQPAPAAEPIDVPEEAEPPPAALTLSSPAFEPGELIPIRFSCDGDNVSPELAWSQAPADTVSFALIMDDPDAPGGTWVHWVYFNIPADRAGLPEGVPADAEVLDGSRQGTNSGRGLGYAGPCPPGETHRYFFKLYALDQTLDLASGITAAELASAMQGHILGTAELMGTYTRD